MFILLTPLLGISFKCSRHALSALCRWGRGGVVSSLFPSLSQIPLFLFPFFLSSIYLCLFISLFFHFLLHYFCPYLHRCAFSKT